ncbi:MAG: membrane-bound lytic murein transglycosylase MltF [Methylococcaceae bacterium]|nr:membrane-bound lytic murein transglycosylase MltF [Methylococcaceae bacterium]
MKIRTVKKLLLFIILIGLLISYDDSDPVIKDIRKQGKLIVLTRNAPTTYYLDANDEPAGFEYDLSKALADSLNVEVEYKLYDNTSEIMRAISEGEGHIVAAGLTPSDSLNIEQISGPGYKTVQQQVVCHRDAKPPKDTAGLLGKSILIIAESGYQDSLLEQKENYPELIWQVTSNLSTEEVLEKVEKKEVDCTIINSNIMSLNRRYYPNLIVAFPISEARELAWMLPPDAEYFKQYVDDWFAKTEESSTLNILNERYYGFADIFDYYDNFIYLKRITSRLPRYETAFKQAAEQYELPWTLLAAQAYQESSWNAKARSSTGVGGLMMLTQKTAEAIGINKRMDPLQSIKGGAKYLDKMLQKIPDDVAEVDRIWFALTAYNVGFAHLLDARELAVRLGKSPNTWHDMKEVLPLLSQKQYYKKLKYGYARGAEPVKYIDRIRYYQDVLVNNLNKSVADDTVMSGKK